jgi:hypothetical protein
MSRNLLTLWEFTCEFPIDQQNVSRKNDIHRWYRKKVTLKTRLWAFKGLPA